ncbi:MAG: DUF1566 domain-containing protein [Ginsengibacter sp.]
MADNIIKPTPGEVDSQRPFPGLQSFEEKNELQFGGRDVEVNELFLLVKRNSPVVVFGKSGIGKTSLLKAGLMPKLQRNSFYPVYFRVDYAATKSPLRQLKDFISEKFNGAHAINADIGDRTLWQYFHDIKLPAASMQPVLILDQFEEIFTIGKDDSREVADLVTELSDLCENRVPFVVHQDYQQRDELIPSDYERMNYRVIISLREDYLAQLEGLKKHMPSLKNSRSRIVQMTTLQAMDAVLKSAKGLIDKEVAVDIIKKLPGISEHDFDTIASDNDNVKRLLVEPFLLSLICFQVNEKRIERKLDKFTPALVSDFKIEDVIYSFYNDTLKEFGDNVSEGIEDTMLTDSGYRKLESVEQLKTNYKIDDAVIAALINKRILRQEDRDGVEYVELIHDVLIPVIKERRNKRIAMQIEKANEEKEEQLKKSLEAETERKEAEAQKKNLRRTRLVATVVSVFAIVAALASVYAWNAKSQAEKARIEAVNASKEVSAQKAKTDSAAAKVKEAFNQQAKKIDSLGDEVVNIQTDSVRKKFEKILFGLTESNTSLLGSNFTLKQEYKDGIIFFIDTGKKGLIASKKDLGKMTWEDAKQACASLGNGWRLPTKNELQTMYRIIGPGADDIGNFANDYYWSSLEYNNDHGQAYLVNFRDGNASYHFNKNRRNSVRPVQDVSL